MAKFVIEGGNRLSGSIKISGNKNSTFPCIAAALLTEEEVYLRNIPNINDVKVMLQILEEIGVETEITNDYIRICASKRINSKLPVELTTKLRGSIVLAGAILARIGSVTFNHPGGDIIGKRSIDVHLDGFRQLGARVQTDDLKYSVKWGGSSNDVNIFFEVPSVTGTENLILASVMRNGKVTLRNVAQEPHVTDLCKMLNLMGAKIEGLDTPTLVITGVKKLSGCDFRISCDLIEMGTYTVAAAVTGGNIWLENCEESDCEPILWPLRKMGMQIVEKNGRFLVSAKKLQAIPTLTTGFWPNFPTDLMSIMIVLATQSRGVSLLRDWLFESRMFFVDKLIAMGAHITIADPHRVVIFGPTKLIARELESPDIRAGMALLLAALIAKGTSTINKAELIERGYEDVVEKITSLGGNIQRLD